ncbi:hypothetical protein ACT2FY_39390 [Paraburkholderia fungorum]|uniref:hypothetical protein n=1 Tax=Paraburkholderia fungorum TaxID=134537 RepID=UPI00402B3071
MFIDDEDTRQLRKEKIALADQLAIADESVNEALNALAMYKEALAHILIAHHSKNVDLLVKLLDVLMNTAVGQRLINGRSPGAQ